MRLHAAERRGAYTTLPDMDKLIDDRRLIR